MSKPAGVEAHPVIGVLIAPPKLPKVHLTEDNKQTSCGRVVTVLVPYRAFSNNPCDCCVKRRLRV